MSARSRSYKPQNERTKKPVYCYQCVAGPDLLRVEEEDGIATRVESNYTLEGKHPADGRVCVKAYGLIQKTYNPNRVQQPMKRTNPNKGREHDPGWQAISWDEALDIVAGKLREVREKGLRDEAGYPRVAASFGGGGTPTQYMGTFPSILSAWGAVDLGFGAGQGVKCYHSEHLYGELWHRAFIVSPDVPRCKFVINCGSNVEASGGVVGVWREADARAHGLRRLAHIREALPGIHRRVVDQRPCRAQADGHIRQHPLQPLELANRPPELLPRLCIAQRQLIGPLRHAQRHRAGPDPLAVIGIHQPGETALHPLGRDHHHVVGDLHVFEDNFRLRDAAQPHRRLAPSDP